MNRNKVLEILARHIGVARGIRVAELARQAEIPERRVRTIVSELRDDGIAVCGHPSTGYYIAANAEELEVTCAFLRARALHSLKLEAKLRNVPLPDLLGQLHLRT